MRDAFPIVCAIGDKLRAEDERSMRSGRQTRPGWRDAKALIYLVAYEGDWRGAAALADALGVGADAQEAIYREVTERHLAEGRGSDPAQPPREQEPA